jgi:hypothetical protein
VVEWSDNGHRALLFPGPDAHVQHFGADGEPVPAAPEPVTRRAAWKVDLAIVERDGRTDAHATLVGDGPGLAADGRARLNPDDPDVPVIGEELAVARALRRLADELLAAAAHDIGATENAPVLLAPR